MTESSDRFDSTQTRVKIVWGLYLVSLVIGLTGIVGVILAYLWRGDAVGDPMGTHFDRQIRTFWIALAGGVIGLLTTWLLIGFLIIAAAVIYLAVMSVVGLMKAFDGKPWPRT